MLFLTLQKILQVKKINISSVEWNFSRMIFRCEEILIIRSFSVFSGVGMRMVTTLSSNLRKADLSPKIDFRHEFHLNLGLREQMCFYITFSRRPASWRLCILSHEFLDNWLRRLFSCHTASRLPGYRHYHLRFLDGRWFSRAGFRY